jgi:hypothetical protein
VWRKDSRLLHEALNGVRGGAIARGQLRPGTHATYEDQNLWAFVVEAADENSAEWLLQASRESRPRDFCLASAAAGSLFCLVVARAVREAVVAYETASSLGRFVPGIDTLLKRYAAET